MKRIYILLSLSLFLIQHAHAQTWTSIGPDFGGYFREFTFHPSNSNIIFAGGDDASGIWKSIDGGQSWQLVSEELPNMSAWHIEIDKNNPNIVFACDVYARYGVAKSVDGGNTWTYSVNGLDSVPSKRVTKLAIASANADTLFISTGLQPATQIGGRYGDGIYKSVDGGLTWSASGLQDTTCPAIIITLTKRLVVATQGQGVFYSTDMGNSWLQQTDIPDTAIVQQIETKDSIVVVATAQHGVFVSKDNGISYTAIGGGAYDIAIGQIQPNLILYSSVLYKCSYDYSTLPTWVSFEQIGFLDNNILTMGIGAKNDTVLVGQLSNNKFFLSTNAGSSWSYPATSPSANYINDVSVDPNNPNHFFASLVVSNTLQMDNQCLIETTNGGTTWQRKGPVASGYKIKFRPGTANSDTLLCGTFTDGLFKSTDGGNTWINKRPTSWVTDIIYHPDYPNEVLIAEVDNILNPTSVGIFKSTDGGETFSSVFTAANLVTKIIHIPNSDSTIASTLWNGLYLSTDRGNSFSSWVLAGDSIKTVAYHNGNVYAGSEAGQLYKISSSSTQNITGSWQQLTEITNIYFKGDTLLVGLNGAEHDRDTMYNPHGSIWASYDFGQNWIDISSNLPCTQFFGNDVFTELNGKLMVGTYGGSFFTLDALPLGISSSLGSEQSLSVFPNPFNESITILIPEEIRNKQVEAIIYDTHGKLIYTLSGFGNDNMQLDLKNFDKGIYLVQLISENLILNTKVIKQ